MSKYDSIKTAADLISEVCMNGLSTDQEDRNRAADIFGNSAVGELAALANSEKQKISSTFYFIAFNVWGWEQATRFFNEHTNPATQKAKDVENQLKAQVNANKELLEDVERSDAQCKEAKEEAMNLAGRCIDAEAALVNAQNEITLLKAKLYDLMTAGA